MKKNVPPLISTAVESDAGCVEITAVRPVRELRGFLRGMDTTIEREEDRCKPRPVAGPTAPVSHDC